MTVAILKNGMPIDVDQFAVNNRVYDIDGILTGFEYSSEKYSFFYVKQYIKPTYAYGMPVESKLKNGYYAEEKFLNYAQYYNMPPDLPPYDRLTEQNLIDNYYYDEANFLKILAKENDIVTVRSIDSSVHNFISEEIEVKFKVVKEVSGKIKYYYKNGQVSIPKTSADEGFISSTLVQTNDLGNMPAGFFYQRNFGVPQAGWSISEELKVNLDRVTTLIAFKIYWIEKMIFPNILSSFQVVDNLGRGLINNTAPGVTELVKLLAELKKRWGFYYVPGTTSPNPTDFLPLFNIINPEPEQYEAYYDSLKSLYAETYKIKESLQNKDDDEKLQILGKLLPHDALLILPLSTRLAILKKLALQDSLFNSDEEYAIKIINTININDQTVVNYFLGWLIDEKFPTHNSLPPYADNIYSLLYNKIQNYSGAVKAIPELFGDKSFSKDNRTRFVEAIYLLWTESKYNPYKNLDGNGNPDYSLIDNSTYTYDKTYSHSAIINYKSEKNRFGIYDDIFTFEFDPQAEGIYFITDENFTLTPHQSNHLYQPITLLYYPSETDTSIRLPSKDDQYNGAIPLFYLAYVDKDGDAKDFNTKLGILIDVVTTVSGIGNLAKLRHLRHLSKLGQILVIIESVQIAAGIMSFLLNFVEGCDDQAFCKKLKTLLFFIEITSLVTDPIAAAKAKKAAREVVEEGIENGWPSGMLDDLDGHTPKQKIEEIADIDIVEYLAKYREKAKKKFLEKLAADTKSFEKYYSDSQIDELLTVAAGKGLSSDDIAGIMHQACRKRDPVHIATVQELTTRMDNIILVRQRGYPFPFTSKAAFDDYVENKIKPFIEKFGLPKDSIKYGGSGLTSPSSFSPGAQDTDWWIFFKNKDEEAQFLDVLEQRYLSYIENGLLPGADARRKIKRMRARYESNGFIDKEYITGMHNGQVVDMRPSAWQDAFFGTTPTDISIKLRNVNEPIPSVTINLQ